MLGIILAVQFVRGVIPLPKVDGFDGQTSISITSRSAVDH